MLPTTWNIKDRKLMDKDKHRYLSYLLRLWQVEEKEHVVWRASLERSGTGERVSV